MIGETISHYKILEKLGEGGMGVVYKAEDTKLKRIVALKFLASELTRDATAKQRFIQEAQAASKLDHPNICTIHAVEETEEGQIFIVMAYYKGETLKEKTDEGPLRIDETLTIAINVAEGLQEAHEHGITHRDIKPSNIMITDKGQTKILDFGLAKSATGSIVTKAGTTLGTIAIMSPEQARGEKVDKRTDIWSLGVVIYNMLTGQMPFKGEYEHAIVYSIMNVDQEPITGVRTGVPIELEKIINKCLEKDKSDRYPTAEGLMVDLRRLRKDTSKFVSTPPVEVKRTEITPPAEQKEEKGTTTLITLTPKRKKILIATSIVLCLVIISTLTLLFMPENDIIDSIAVLPFENRTNDPELEILSDGMAQGIINRLSKLPNMEKVISFASVKHYKGRDIDAKTVSKELNVRAVVITSMIELGENIRINIELIDGLNNTNIGGKIYSQQRNSFLDMEEFLAKEIVDFLGIQLSGQDEKNLTKVYTEDLEAKRLYILGRHEWNKRTEESLRKGLDYFYEAIRIDPDYGLAYAGVADSYNLLERYSYNFPREVMPKAKDAAMRAIDIDETLGEAHNSLAFARRYYDWEWAAAEYEYKQAIKFNPNYETAHHWYGLFLAGMGRFNEAIVEMKKAQDLAPLSLIINTNFAYVLYFAGRIEESIEQFNLTLQMEPNFIVAHQRGGLAYLLNGRHEEALQHFQQAVAISDSSTEMLASLGYGYAVTGYREKAIEVINRLNELARNKYVSSYDMAIIYIALGEKDIVFELLEKAYTERSSSLAWIKVEPILDGISDDPRYLELLKKMGLDK